MGKKGGSWFSSVKKVFKSSSKDSPVPENKVIPSPVFGKLFANLTFFFNFNFILFSSSFDSSKLVFFTLYFNT